ncbi:MAG: hypothetical protein HC828_15115, partial [Blastochloris sp.]|nr:hypothetical protein [Blastochloris sp.]
WIVPQWTVCGTVHASVCRCWVPGALVERATVGAGAAAACVASVVCGGIVAGVIIVAAAARTAYVACQNEVLICQAAAPTSPQRIDAGAAPTPPRHTGNHTPAPVTPPSPPHPVTQDVPRGGNIQGTPWELDESLVCTQEGFPMPEAEDFKVTTFPAPQESEPLIFLTEELYHNRYPERWAVEQSQAERLGIDPAPAGTSEWHETLTYNQLILWAVDETGQLIIMPQFVRGEEPAHPVLVNARPVRAAGTAQISFENGQYIGERIDGQSGHYYQLGWPAEAIGRRAFAQEDIFFP